jgi:alcohol dehydrogenase class IV
MRFEFATATRIIFGSGTLSEVSAIAPKLGSRALVVTTRTVSRAQPLFDLLDKAGIPYECFAVDGEPTVETARAGTELARQSACNLIIGFGGGSVLDMGKAISGLLTNEGDPLDYLEIVGRGQPITKPAAPFIAIPTTAGTGAEVTMNAVLASQEHRQKVSLRSPLMLPRVALIDSALTLDLPPAITATTGMDALTQCLEPFVSNKANPMTDSLAREGMIRAARSLRRAYEQGDDSTARQDMAITSLFGGLSLANAKLGAVHGFAGVIGGMFPAPHGAVCARLLPPVMAVNVQTLKQRQPDSDALRRYDEIARILTGNANAKADDGVTWVAELGSMLQIPPLSTYGITPADFPVLIEKSASASSMQGNPLKLTPDELKEILTRAL